MRSTIKCILLLAAMMLRQPLSAQFAGGVSAGLNFCQVDGDSFSGYGKVGPQLGGFVYYPLSDMLAVQTEISFSNRGARFADSETGFFYHLRLNYTEWSILGNLTVVDNGDQAIVVQGGIAPSYLLSAREGQSGFTADITRFFRRMDVPAQVGLTLRLSQHFSLVSRFNYSIFDISAFADPSNSARLSNNYFSLMFRWEWR